MKTSQLIPTLLALGFRYAYALINAAKAAIASLIGYLVGHYLGDYLHVAQMYSWIVVTILVIMSSQPNLGGAIDKALMRFLATVISATIAIIIIFFLADYKLIELTLSLCLIFIGVFIANTVPKYTYAGVLGAITIAITMFGQEVDVSFAFYRALEVIIGIVIALLVNRFLFPIRAEKQIEKSFSQAINEIQTLHDYLVKGVPYDNLLTKMFNHFSKQNNLIKEIQYEKAKIHIIQYQTINSLIRRLYRYICVIHEYIDAYPAKRDKFTHQDHFLNLFKTINQLLELLSNSFITKKSANTSELLIMAKKQLDDVMLTFQVSAEFRHISTLAFSLNEILLIIDKITQAQKTIY